MQIILLGSKRSKRLYSPDIIIPKIVGLAGHPYLIPRPAKKKGESESEPVTAIGPDYNAFQMNFHNNPSLMPTWSNIILSADLSTES